MCSARVWLLILFAGWSSLGTAAAETKPFPLCPRSGPASSVPCATTPFPKTFINCKYTEQARQARVEGNLILTLIITAKGKPENIRVIKSLGNGLDEEAVIAAQQWRFTPGTYGGRPVAVAARMSIWFTNCNAYGVSAIVPAPDASYSISETVKGASHITRELRACGLDPKQMMRKEACAPMPVHLPRFPDSSHPMEVEGKIRLSLQILLDGTTGDIRVVNSLDKILDEEAVITAAQWRFRPALYKGQPAPARTTAEFRFGICADPKVSSLVE